jgi:hypothetical protein
MIAMVIYEAVDTDANCRISPLNFSGSAANVIAVSRFL